MTAWLLPLVAAAFWAGILLEPAVRSVTSPFVWVGAGLALLIAVAWAAPRRDDAPDSLIDAGLVAPEPPAVASLGPERPTSPRAPPVLALATALAFVVLGAGWAGLRVERLEGSFLSNLAGTYVTVAGDLRSDPSVGSFGWSALGAISEVTSPQRTRIHEVVWLEGEGPLLRGAPNSTKAAGSIGFGSRRATCFAKSAGFADFKLELSRSSTLLLRSEV